MTRKELSFAIFGNNKQTLEADYIKEVFDYLTKHNARIFVEEHLYENLCKDFVKRELVSGVITDDNFNTDYAISLGGDGTFLRVASKVGEKQIPIIGVNMGRLGFLANVLPGEIKEVLDAIYRGDFDIDERSVIKIESENEVIETSPYALNDISILKRDNASMITIHTNIDDEYLVTYQADGLIVSTPTGSTAYSLSAGGPIVTPELKLFLITPIAPHNLNTRPIILSGDVKIVLTLAAPSEFGIVNIDGHTHNKINIEDEVEISYSEESLKIVLPDERNYYNVLREKLKWGENLC